MGDGDGRNIAGLVRSMHFARVAEASVLLERSLLFLRAIFQGIGADGSGARPNVAMAAA